ncbi:kinase-like domain-containing protein, partial [Syncephalis pseudoplumigaleata]
MAPSTSESTSAAEPQPLLHRIPHPLDKQAWLEIKLLIGTGAYGRVYLADDQQGRRFVVKQLANTPAAHREVDLHSRCSGHLNVLRMYGWYQDQHGIWMILEYCPDGDLFHHITHANGAFSGDISAKELAVKHAFSQICNGVAWCHSRGVYHRDLKPENVLVWLEKEADTGYVRPILKIADFGLATDKKCTSDFGCGSTFYMSPECIGTPIGKPLPYGSAMTDVWSLGILLLNMVTAQNPWRQAHPREDAFMYYQHEPKTFLAKLLPISGELQACVCRALELNVAKRCSVQELCLSVIECSRL